MYLITRRDFLKYCSVAAGALGLSASSIMKIEQALADQADTGPNLLWVSGASCSGCITSLLNTIFYADIRTVLLDVADLVFQETVQAACGATLDGTSITNEALENTRSAIAGNPSTSPYVLLVEGGVPTAKPKTGTGLTLGNVGEFCDVGPLVGGATPSTMYDQVRALASSANCAAVLSIGTCSAFGGIPAARGSVIGQKKRYRRAGNDSRNYNTCCQHSRLSAASGLDRRHHPVLCSRRPVRCARKQRRMPDGLLRRIPV